MSGDGNPRTYREDRSNPYCNPDRVGVMVTSNIATNLDRGSDPQTNTAARLVLTAVGVSLPSPKNLFERSLAADCPRCPPLNMGLDSSLSYPA